VIKGKWWREQQLSPGSVSGALLEEVNDSSKDDETDDENDDMQATCISLRTE
jgi:hypothetical protein